MTQSLQHREAILAIMGDGRFRTLLELDAALRRKGQYHIATSISARVRELRNPRYGGYTVERRRRKGASAQTFEYALRPPRPATQQILLRGG